MRSAALRGVSGALLSMCALVACGDDGEVTRGTGGSGATAGQTAATSGEGGATSTSSGEGGASGPGTGGGAGGPGAGGEGPTGSGGQGGETATLTPWPSTTERCGGLADEDLDGLVDEDCAPSLFGGVFVPAGVGLGDPSVLDALEADAARPLAVVQTYRSTSAAGADNARLDLEAIWARGATPHLNVEPLGYTPAQLEDAGDDPDLAADVATMADAVAGALADHPGRSLFLTFAAEMNGDWTDWGCLDPGAFISFYRWAHGVFDDALAARAPAIDPRRVRWVFGPNNVSSAGCGSPAAYYPGHAFTDYLGMSAYRSGTQSVDAAVIAPAHDLLDDVALEADLRTDRFIVLQTGTRDEAGDDRDAWIRGLFSDLAADPVFRGAIYFDSADWAVATSDGGLVTELAGYDGLVDALADAPVADARLEGAFDPYFWDVGLDDPSYPEVQTLRALELTSGCAVDPPRFCPSVSLTRRDAAVLLGRVFAVEPDLGSEPLFDDVLQADAAYGFIQALAARGVLEACGVSAFCPNDALRRIDLAHALVRLAEIAPVPPDAAPFADVGALGEDAAVQALGSVSLVDDCGAGNFCPDLATARNVGARWIVRVAGLPEGGRLAP